MMSGERFTVTKAVEIPARSYGTVTINPGFRSEDHDVISGDAGHPGRTGERSNSRDTNKDSMTGYEKNLYLYHEDVQDRPRIATLVNTLASYNATIPAPTDPDAKPPVKAARLGTILGVFLPCCQNILGVILFIRMSWLVGCAGVVECFLGVLMCCLSTLLTSISLSAIATNGVVPAGGSYYLISRALGPEFGGAVGILFFLGTSVAAAMYIVGAVELLIMYISPDIAIFKDYEDNPTAMFNNFRVYGTGLLIILGTIVYVGVQFVSKFAAVSLACVIGSVIAIVVGVFTNMYGNDKIQICMLGDRLLNSDYECNKTEGSGLWDLYCPNVTIDNITRPKCDEYFETHEVRKVNAIQGLASGILMKNLGNMYRETGDVISEDSTDVPNSQTAPTYNYVLADMTTSFTVLIGIYFPSVTGIMAGSNRSGDLADAQKSIPIGTLAATCTTSIIYLSSVIMYGASVDGILMTDKFGKSSGGKLVVANIAWPNEWVILIGSLLSTIGAGLQSLTGAPRLLQAIAKDNVIPFLNVFSVTSAKNEPTRALILTLIITEMGIMAGAIDYLTPIVSMFFLMCYGFVNLACAVQTLLRTPNWRPRFKYYHWSLSFIGLALVVSIMFMTSWYYALIAMGIAGCIYKYIELKGAEKEWGDGIRGLALSAARYSLLRLEEGPPHTKNWRPQLMVLIKMNEELVPKYRKLVTFASQLKAGKGLILVCSVLEGDFPKCHGEAQAAKQSLRKVMEEERVKGFADVVVSKDAVDGINHLIQSAGLGGLKPNTVILGWPYGWRQSTDTSSWRSFLGAIRHVSAAKNALLVPKGINFFPDSHEKVSGYIDVWWIVHDGGLLMLLPFLLKQHKTWKNCKMRIFTVAQMEDNSIQMKKDLKTFLYNLRLDADVEVIEMMDSDISAYTYERTLMMEQRTQMLKDLRVNKKEELNIVQSILDHHQRPLEETTRTNSKVRFRDADPIAIEPANDLANDEPEDEEVEEDNGDKIEIGKEDGDTPAPQMTLSNPKWPQGALLTPAPNNTVALTVPMTDGDLHRSESGSSFEKLLNIRPDEANVRRMHTAIKLNEAIVAKSHDAQLVIVNLPGPPKVPRGEENYMEFLEVLTEGLERVLMVRGGGREVITIYT